MEKNIIFFDESKFGDGSLYCFAGLIYKNQLIYQNIENELIAIRNNYNSIFGNNFELKGNKIGKTIDVNKKQLITELLTCIKKHVLNDEVIVQFFVMHGNDLNYANVNLESVINGVLANITTIPHNTIQKYLYYQLSVFLIKRLSSLPFPGDIVHSVISDNVYNMVTTSTQTITTHGNIFSMNQPVETVVPTVIQNIHNLLPCKKFSHNGFELLKFLDSKTSVSLQVCDIISNFMMNSIRYLYFNYLGNSLKDDYSDKFNLLSTFIEHLEAFPINDLNLTMTSNNDITSTSKFNPIEGRVR